MIRLAHLKLAMKNFQLPFGLAGCGCGTTFSFFTAFCFKVHGGRGLCKGAWPVPPFSETTLRVTKLEVAPGN